MKKSEKYPLPMRIMHWLMSSLILGMLALGWYMTQLDDSVTNKFSFFNFHESLGVCILLLAVTRIFFRFKTRPPALPSHLSLWNRRLAQGVHFLLYVVLIVMPLSGIFMTLLSGYKVPFFFFEFPNFFPENKGAGQFLGQVHGYLAFGIATLIGLHVLGILKQLLIDKKNLIKRMI